MDRAEALREVDRASEPLVTRLRDAAMVLATAPLRMDREAGETLAADCDEGADEIERLRAALTELREAGAEPDAWGVRITTTEAKRVIASVSLSRLTADQSASLWRDPPDRDPEVVELFAARSPGGTEGDERMRRDHEAMNRLRADTDKPDDNVPSLVRLTRPWRGWAYYGNAGTDPADVILAAPTEDRPEGDDHE